MDTVNHSVSIRENVEINILFRLVDDLESTVAEVACSDSSSLPRIGSEHQTLQLAATFSEGEDQLKTVRRVWSREEFLHETAGMGGPDMSMRPRSVEVH
jgi:hypothetical protein